MRLARRDEVERFLPGAILRRMATRGRSRALSYFSSVSTAGSTNAHETATVVFLLVRHIKSRSSAAVCAFGHIADQKLPPRRRRLRLREKDPAAHLCDASLTARHTCLTVSAAGYSRKSSGHARRFGKILLIAYATCAQRSNDLGICQQRTRLSCAAGICPHRRALRDDRMFVSILRTIRTRR